MPSLRFLALNLTLYSLTEVFWRVLSARGEQGRVLRIQVITTITRLLSGAVLISLYGAVGGGMAGSHRAEVFAVGSQAITRQYYLFGFAGSIGGGLDLRLSRLMSLRGEVRDFLAARGFDGASGHNHVIFGFGVGFHW